MTDLADFDDALARAFARVERASKDAKNPHLGNKYPTLASVVDACREALLTEGFSWPQKVSTRRTDGGLEVVVTTQLRRKGVMIEADLPMPVGGKGTAQDIGSAITYGRRYGLAAMVGVCPEDDDGNAASQPRERKSEPQTPKNRERDGDKPKGRSAIEQAREVLTKSAKGYIAEAKAQGAQTRPWLDVASEAIGREWKTDDQHTVVEYIKAADLFSKLTEQLRTGDEAAA